MLLRALIVALAISLARGGHVSPVFLWGVQSPPKSSLQTVTQDNFADLIAPLLDSHMVVAFQEEHLTSRDFLCTKEDGSESCYAHLSAFSPKAYYASVANPIESLRTITTKREYNIVDSNGKLQAPLECTPGKVTFVSFDDVTADGRADVLEAHDVAIAGIAKELGDCRVVYLYMSTPSSAKSRARRATTAASPYTFRQKNQFLIYWQELAYNDGSGNGYADVVISSAEVHNTSDTSFQVVMTSASSQKLQFNITLGSDGYYTMSHIEYAGQSFYSSLMNAPTSFSYHCGNLTLNTIPPSTVDAPPIAYLKWNALQFQAPFNAKTSEDFKFGDSWDCVPFFTPGILSGLFVVILLLAIVFTGICWMVDINTMDRFDDPKGKTITINASE